MNSVGTRNETNRVVWLEKTLGAIPPGARILDAGAGEQQFRHFCSHLNYVAQDFAQYDGEGNSQGLHTGSWNQSQLDIVSDITAVPEPDGSFDAIMCIEVFEHLPYPINALQEFNRLLKPGGRLIITAPFCSLTHFAPFHFYSGFNRYFYERLLPETGFEVSELIQNGNFFEYLGQEVRRVPFVLRHYCGERQKFLDRLCKYWFLKILARLSRCDQGSSELLCFGYFVSAKKL